MLNLSRTNAKSIKASLKMHNQHITVLAKNYMVSLHGEYNYLKVNGTMAACTALTGHCRDMDQPMPLSNTHGALYRTLEPCMSPYDALGITP